MVITRQIKEKLSSTPAGVVLTTRDFGVEMRYQPALAKALNRLVLRGELQKIAKGKYYIPKKTIFGTLKPSDSELVKDFLEQDGKIVGYITGTAAFASMGLTTQISSSILIASPYHPKWREGFFPLAGERYHFKQYPIAKNTGCVAHDKGNSGNITR